MKILIVTPAFNPPHGGLRIINEWASRLTQWHEVTIHPLKPGACTWMKLDPRVTIMDVFAPSWCDCMILTSPHSIHLADHPKAPKRIFLFMQMLEHLFRPNDRAWAEMCRKFYTSPHPLILISDWNQKTLEQEYKRTGPTYYVGNGVNTEDFPIEPGTHDGKTVLIEGWESLNESKDPDRIGPKVADRLRKDGFRILAYSQSPLRTMPEAVDEYHQRPTLEMLNSLYRRATILIKATKYDARACAPMEAMTKGVPTVRAIIKGDDDLTAENSLRCAYNLNELYFNARKLLDNPQLRERLSAGCHAHVENFSWAYWMERINGIINFTMPQPEEGGTYSIGPLTEKPECKTVIVAVKYLEPEWAETKRCIEACNVPVVYVDRDRPGIGSLSEAINRGFREACAAYDFKYVWFVTNVTFEPEVLTRLEGEAERFPWAAVHPRFDSDHHHLRYGGDHVPFVEFTAPLIRRTMFTGLELDEDMPYWGQDLDWGHRARQRGFSMCVPPHISVDHVYIRNSKQHHITKQRKAMRRATDQQTTNRLIEKYGTDWKSVLGYK